MRGLRSVLPALLALSVAGCVIRQTAVRTVPLQDAARISTPARVHLTDGRIALVRRPWSIASDTVRGEFAVYDARLSQEDSLRTIPLGQVAGIETYASRTDAGPTILLNALWAGAGIATVVAAASCCTF